MSATWLPDWPCRYPLNWVSPTALMTTRAMATRASRAVIILTRSGVRPDSARRNSRERCGQDVVVIPVG